MLAAPARVTVIVLDDYGQRLRFRVDQIMSAQNGRIPADKTYGYAHEFRAALFDEVTVMVSVNNFENSPVRNKALVGSPDQVIVINKSTQMTEFRPGTHFWPARIRLPQGLCISSGGLRWAEIRGIGQPGPVRNVRVTECTIEVGRLVPGRYSVIIYAEEGPLAASHFVVGPAAPNELRLDFLWRDPTAPHQ